MNDEHSPESITANARAKCSRSALALPASRSRPLKPKTSVAQKADEQRADPVQVVGRAAEYLAIKGELHQRLLNELENRKLRRPAKSN